MTTQDGRVAEATGLSCSAPSPSAGSRPDGFDPSREPGEGVYFMPRCTISRRWDGDLDALLFDSACRTYGECRSWALGNLTNLWLYGVYYQDVYRFDENSGEPFNAVMGDMLGVGRIAIIGGSVWEREFASDSDEHRNGEDPEEGLSGEAMPARACKASPNPSQDNTHAD